jgi:hypothetical protein
MLDFDYASASGDRVVTPSRNTHPNGRSRAVRAWFTSRPEAIQTVIALHVRLDISSDHPAG